VKKTILSAILIVCAVGCQPVTEEADDVGVKPLSDADVAAIKAIAPAFDKAALAGDWDAWIAIFAEDGVDMAANRPMAKGHSALRELLASYAGLVVTESEHKYDEINGYGDIAYATGTYEEEYTVEGVTEPIRDKGKVLSILRKQPDGSWLIAVNSWNSDLPQPE